MTQSKNFLVDPRETDRKERIAMTLASNNLYKALTTWHPKIVSHLQSLPNAQAITPDDN